MKRFLCLGTVLFLVVLWSACGDVFRPIIIPNPQQFPNPQAAHTVVTVNDNGTIVAGSAMVVDVTGDANSSQRNVGLRPVHAVQQSGTVVLVVNQSVSGAAQDSVTKLNFSGVGIGSTSTITLPTSYNASGPTTSAPNFVATTESNQAYVLMPNYQPNQGGGPFVPSVGVINTTQNTVVTTIPVGNNPVALAETLDGKKLYVANQGDGTIGAFNTADRSTRSITGSLTSPPIWLAARSDSQRVYVLESSGTLATLAYLDTHTTTGPDTLTETSISVPGAIYMWYDVILNRLYIPGGQQLTIVDVSQSAPGVLAVVPISTVSPGSRAAGDPCASTAQGTLAVASATSLPDGSRAYVGSFYIDSLDNVCPQVTVITTSNNTIKTAVPIPGFPDATNPSTAYYVPICASTRDTSPLASGFRFNMAAGGDSNRAYLSSCDGGNVNIIDTSTDSYILNIPAPYSVRPPVPPATLNPPQNPVFMIAGP